MGIEDGVQYLTQITQTVICRIWRTYSVAALAFHHLNQPLRELHANPNWHMHTDQLNRPHRQELDSYTCISVNKYGGNTVEIHACLIKPG